MSEPEPNVLTVAVDRDAGGVDLVALRGELDFASGEPLSTAFADLTGGPRRVVVDLSDLEFVDSSGVKMLVAAARAVEDAGGAFVLAGPTATVRRVFDILHLADVLTVVETRQAALDEIARSEPIEARREGSG
jgi:anti-anti-sigma factor